MLKDKERTFTVISNARMTYDQDNERRRVI